MDDTFIQRYTMIKAHELGYQVVFNNKGTFKGYKGYPAVIYTRFLLDVLDGLEMPDEYTYIQAVDKNEFYNFIYANIESWVL